MDFFPWPVDKTAGIVYNPNAVKKTTLQIWQNGMVSAKPEDRVRDSAEGGT